jgi:hypothetical protein
VTNTPKRPRDAGFVALEEIHAAALRALPQDVAG